MNNVLRRALAATTVAAMAVGGLLVSDPPATAASSCSWYCIDVPNVSGATDGAVFTFSTTTLSRTKVVVTDQAGQHPYTVKEDDSWGANYQVTASDSDYFKQGTVYKYEIYATDTAGATWRSSGEFATLVRSASVKYDNLHIVEDGDNVGPGDFFGSGRCGENADWLALAPLQTSQVPQDEAELSDGANLGLSGYFPCKGLIGDSIEPQTGIADDDKWVLGANWEYWAPTSPHAFEAWTSGGSYEAAYTSGPVSDPLDPTATGSKAAPIYEASPQTDPTGQPAGIRYRVSGAATFTHSAPAVTLAKPTSGPANLGAQVAQGNGADIAVVKWQPKAFPAITGALVTRVEWKPSESSTWEYSTVYDLSDSSFQFSNLKLGTKYDIAVSLVMPGGLLELRSTTTYTTPGPASSPTTITGWSSTKVTAAVGTSVTSKVGVSTDGTPRSVALQSRKAGAASWTTVTTVASDAAGNATLKYAVAATSTQWRVFVPATNAFDEATSAIRELAPKTTISGFNSTTVSRATGTSVTDTVAVTPGSMRSAKLYYRKVGTTAWTLQATLVTDANGVVTLPEVVRKGAYQWVLNVPADPSQGGGAWTALRRITGY